MINKREIEALEKYLRENTEDSPRIARSFLEDAIPILKMRIARKVIDDKAFGKCPCCNYTFKGELINEYDMKYCVNCGQELDFGE